MPLFSAILALLAAGVGADVAVQNTWTQSSETTVTGDGWKAQVQKANAVVTLTAGGQEVRLLPVGQDGVLPTATATCEVKKTEGEEAIVVQVSLAAGDERMNASYRFTAEGTLCITPGEGMRGIRILAPIAVGVLLGLRLDDVLYRAGDYSGQSAVCVPNENWFAGLLEGENGIAACAWPEGGQSVRLLKADTGAQDLFTAIDVTLGGKKFYLELLAGDAIWHREKLELSYLEKTVELEWRPPFEAAYKTQLPIRGETTVQRTFMFSRKPYSQYFPEAGDCSWPVWFENGHPQMLLSKKIPPRGEAIIYPFEDGARTLTGFVRRTPVWETIDGRTVHAALPYGPRDAPNVGFVACGGTQVMRRTLFALGLEAREKEFLEEYTDFLADYVAIVQQRHIGYLRFIDETRRQLRDWVSRCGDQPEACTYVEHMIEQADFTETDLLRKLEMYGDNAPEDHIRHGAAAADRLKQLLGTGDPEVYPECEELIDVCNMLAWAQAERVGMRFSMLVRAWAQSAATACAGAPAALDCAQAVRMAIRNALNTAPPW